MNEAPSYPLVWIEWDDASSIDGWTAAAEMAAGVRKCLTVGWLMRETSTELYVSGTRSDDDGCCTIIIPKECVTSRLPFLPPKVVLAEDLRHG